MRLVNTDTDRQTDRQTDKQTCTHTMCVKGELNPETIVGLNEYLREIKFCTGQESVDVVQ